MTQPQLTLYHFPGACSRVSVCALEAAALEYRLELVNLTTNAQSQPAYAAVSSLGKVPLLLINGEPLAENAAILAYIGALKPDAGLFPADAGPRMRAECVGGLSFCSGTLHPLVRGIANPSRLTDGDGEPVRRKSWALAIKSFAYAERRLEQKGWWLGERSIIDVYLDWAFSVARLRNFDTAPFPLLDGLADRLSAWPAYGRMQKEEAQSRTALGL